MKRNVTIVLTDETVRWLRGEAVRLDMSVSEYLCNLVEREKLRTERHDEARARFLTRKPQRLGPTGAALPTRTQVHER